VTLAAAEQAEQSLAPREHLQIERNLSRRLIEVVETEHRGIAASVEHRENMTTTRGQDPPFARADFGALLPNPN
jgi:hypothetical protein